MAMHGVFLEMRSAVRDIRALRTDWRRVGMRVLPVAAAAAAGAGALFLRKRLDPPHADLLAQRATFRCQFRDDLAKRGLPSAAFLEKSLQEAGADVAALRRAARRLRGPIERDLLRVELAVAEASASGSKSADELRRQMHRDLVEAWRAAGLLDEPLVRPRPRPPIVGIDPITQVNESYGRDVGSEVALCLLREPEAQEDPSCLAPEEWSAAASALRDHGVVLLKSFLPASQVLALRERFGVQSSALDKARNSRAEDATPVRSYDAAGLQAEDPDVELVVSTPGRRHYYLRGRTLEEVVRHVQAGAMPLVWEHLANAAAAAGYPPGQLPYISEVQLLVSDPCAVDQFWHIDNTAPGLTVFVPLTPVPEDLGPTVFLPGSQHLFAQDKNCGAFRWLGRWAASAFSSNGPAVGVMGAGDALIYDSRIVHRGAVNRRYDRTRIALVFRYDFERPPGVGLIGAQLVSWLGNSLSCIQRLYRALPGPCLEAPKKSGSS